jgi:hypothetical protein
MVNRSARCALSAHLDDDDEPYESAGPRDWRPASPAPLEDGEVAFGIEAVLPLLVEDRA